MPRPSRSRDPRRALPAVETLLHHPALEDAMQLVPRRVVTDAIREVLAAARDGARNRQPPPDADALAVRAAARAHALVAPSVRRVLNATGVVLHTNLGRAPLPVVAREAVAEAAAGYATLEFDLATGRRGERGAGVSRWLTRLTGAEDAIAVNNGAAAILLALTAVAAGRPVIVSRGELVEIGGSFRIPDVLARSGARLIEVGTTNRTHLRDYEQALARHDDVAALLRVHRSNFRIEGFTARPALAELAALAKRRRVALVEDLGSGALVALDALGLEPEPTVAESLAAGVSLVTASGDKLLGGAQAGLILGARRFVALARKDPLARALRLDKLQLAALEATLALYADPDLATGRVPALAMLKATAETLEPRAQRLARALAAEVAGLRTRVVPGEGEVGGGALPLQKLPGFVVEVAHATHAAQELERLARSATPPLIGTVRGGRFRLDPRTLTDDELDELVLALAGVLGRRPDTS